MTRSRTLRILVNVFILILMFVPATGVFAAETEKDLFKKVNFYFKNESVSMHIGDQTGSLLIPIADTGALDNETNIKVVDILNSEDFKKSQVYTSSDPEVVCFIDTKNGPVNYVGEVTECQGIPVIKALKEGKAVITLKYPTIGKSIECQITVEGAGLYCRSFKYYAGNSYVFQLKGRDITPVSFKSSDKTIAKVDEKTGEVTTLKKGKVTISCKASDGNTYKKKITIAKPGISQTKIIINPYVNADGKHPDYIKNYPLVVYGYNVKKWKTSDKKVAVVEELKIDEYTSIGFVKYKGNGSCTITAYTTDGKKLKCKVKTKGVEFSAETLLSINGYPESKLKKTYPEFYKTINKKLDYGNVVVWTVVDDKIKLNNGNKAVTIDADTCNKMINKLDQRFPYDGHAAYELCNTGLVKPEKKSQIQPMLSTYVFYIKNNGIY